MGTFDEFHFVGSDANLVTCAAGHPQFGGLQTKDLDCTMSHFYVFERLLYESPSPLSGGETRRSVGHLVENGELVEVVRTRYIPAPRIDGGVTLYTTCMECEPVFFESEHAFRDISRAQPWCQWIAVFHRGKLVEVQKDRCETRDDVKAKMGRIGSAPLPEGDRVARRELELWRKERSHS